MAGTWPRRLRGLVSPAEQPPPLVCFSQCCRPPCSSRVAPAAFVLAYVRVVLRDHRVANLFCVAHVACFRATLATPGQWAMAAVKTTVTCERLTCGRRAVPRPNNWRAVGSVIPPQAFPLFFVRRWGCSSVWRVSGRAQIRCARVWCHHRSRFCDATLGQVIQPKPTRVSSH